jgi:hypothetical protein
MKIVRAFMLGIAEFRSSFTTHTAHPTAYDVGRELAHRATFRRWDV